MTRTYGKSRRFYDTAGRVKPMGGSKTSDEVIVTKPDGTRTVEHIGRSMFRPEYAQYPDPQDLAQGVSRWPAKQRHKAALNDTMGQERRDNGRRDRWLAVRHVVVQRDHAVCQYCREEPGEVADLIVHEADGGQVNAGNAVAACTGCHAISRTIRADTFEERRGYVLWQREVNERG